MGITAFDGKAMGLDLVEPIERVSPGITQGRGKKNYPSNILVYGGGVCNKKANTQR
jgi:hypothetical protein